MKLKRSAILWLAEWVILMLLWLLLVGKSAEMEILIGALAAALAAAAAKIVNGQNFARFYPEARWLFEIWRLPGYLISGSAVIYRVLLESIFLGRQSSSRIQAVGFKVGRSDERSAARRALATILTTIPPNYIVIGIDEREDLILVHQIRATGVPEVARKLGAQ
jgi:multisubunit Na+/H+ antiporter MnhE subunit